MLKTWNHDYVQKFKIENHIEFGLYNGNSLGILSEEDFVQVADTKDIPHFKMKEVQVDGENICVANVDGKYYAIGNACTPMGGPLAEGKLEGNLFQCPWHGSRFDITTGKVLGYQQ